MQHTAPSTRQQDMFRRVVLLGTPVILGILELGHPLLDHMNPIKMLVPIVTWWVVLHILLIPFFALMGYTFFLLLRGVENPAAMLARYATVVYISFTIGYDTLVGLSSGILASNADTLPPAQQNVIQQAMRDLYISSPITLSYLILLGSGIVAICSMSWALARAGVLWLPCVVLLGTVLSAYSHATPFGPLGSAFFFLAALWIELVWRKSSSKEGVVAAPAANKGDEFAVNVPGGD